jgi:hypothetical protein
VFRVCRTVNKADNDEVNINYRSFCTLLIRDDELCDSNEKLESFRIGMNCTEIMNLLNCYDNLMLIYVCVYVFTQPPIQWVPGGLSLGIKAAGA